MTTIKNKQTGETLTGEIRSDLTNHFFFKINGTREDVGAQMRHDEWEIIPPPLPTGIGAVVQNAKGWTFTRISSATWATGESVFATNQNVLDEGTLKILSEGVAL